MPVFPMLSRFRLLIVKLDDILKGMKYDRVVKKCAIFFVLFVSIFASCKRLISTEVWLGVYLNGQKIGFQHIYLKRHDDGFLITDEEFLKVMMYGKEKQLSTSSTIKVDGDFQLNAFQFTLKTADQTVQAEGNYWNDTLYIDIMADNIKRHQVIPAGGKLLTPGSFVGMLMAKKVRPGRYLFFDPSTFSLDTATVEFEGTRNAELRGKSVKCKLYSVSYMGTKNTYWVYDDGKIARVEMPMQMMAVEEPPDEAKKIGTPMDILSFYSIKVNRPIPQDSREVVLRLDGIKPSLFDLDFGPQYLIEAGDTWAEVKVTVTGRETTLRDTSRYLASDAFIQADDPLIKSYAEKITAGLQSDSQKVVAIMDWVYDSLEKKPSVTVPSAVEVLKQRYGDCNEHSALFAAFARAAGIPTEIIVGLIYNGEAYFYHAWDAVYINGRWEFIDPIFHEFPASARHLMLKRGGIDKQSEIVSIIGTLKIGVLEVK